MATTTKRRRQVERVGPSPISKETGVLSLQEYANADYLDFS
jgi:hypothetical protein